MKRHALPVLTLCCLAGSGCAVQPPVEPDPRDPLERINRATFRVNMALDRTIAEPAARAYQRVTPDVVERGISNVLDNAGYPVVILNQALQGKFVPALRDTGRFLLNTTLGLGGLFDPAAAAGLLESDEDFGQTLAVWGIPSGPYLMLPLLGPSTLRDALGDLADEFADPRQHIEDDTVRLSVTALRLLDTRAGLLAADDILEDVYDPYAVLRNAYLQRRAYVISDGEIVEEAIDDELLEELEAEAGIGEEEE